MIHGLLDHQAFLMNILNAALPERIEYCEVGLASGRTLLHLLKTVPRLHATGVEIGSKKCDLVKENTKEYAHRTEIVCSSSLRAAKEMRKAGRQFDLVWVDAAHSDPEVSEDVENYWHLVKPGGIFAGHDIFSCKDAMGLFSVRKAVERFCQANSQWYTVAAPSCWMTVRDGKTMRNAGVSDQPRSIAFMGEPYFSDGELAPRQQHFMTGTKCSWDKPQIDGHLVIADAHAGKRRARVFEHSWLLNLEGIKDSPF